MPYTRETRAPHPADPADPAYRTFADALSHFVWVTGPDGTLEYLNAAGRAYTGRALDDLMGRDWHDVVHPADRPAVIARWAACLATGDRFAAEYRVRRHDGDYRWHSCRGGPYRDADGRVLGWVGDGIDVHDRRTAEETLALQTAVLEAVATGAPLTAALDRLAAGVERLADGLLCSVLLLDGDRLRDAAGPSLPAAYRAAVDGVRIGPAVGSCGTAAFRREPVVVTDITTDPLWEGYRGLALGHGLRACWSTPVLGRDGQVLGTFALYHRTPRGPRPDEVALVATATHLAAVAIERRRAEGTIWDREELLRTVLDQIPCAVFWKDRSSVYQGCNARFARDCGLGSPAEVVGRTDLDTNVDPAEAAHFRACDRRVLETGEPLLGIEETRTLADGRVLALLTTKVPLRDATGAVVGVLGVYQDETDRKRREEGLREAAKADAVGRLAGGAAHVYNNLLTVVTGYAEVALGTLGSGHPARTAVEQIRDAGGRAADLTVLLLACGRRLMLRPEAVDASAFVAGSAPALCRELGPGAELILRPGPGALRVRIDPGFLGLALRHLVANAREAVPAGGTVTVETGAAVLGPGVARDGGEVPPGRYVVVTVSDRGRGMPADVAGRLFEPFNSAVPGAAGLGLAGVNGFVRQSGGHVEVETAPGRGTTVRLYLPAFGEDAG